MAAAPPDEQLLTAPAQLISSRCYADAPSHFLSYVLGSRHPGLSR